MRVRMIILLVILVAVGIYAYQKFTRRPADLMEGKPDVEVKATELIARYGTDEKEANKKYLGKVLDVSGNVIAVERPNDSATMVLVGEPGSSIRISCLMNPKYAFLAGDYNKGDAIRIRGVCAGFFTDVQLNRCVIIK